MQANLASKPQNNFIVFHYILLTSSLLRNDIFFFKLTWWSFFSWVCLVTDHEFCYTMIVKVAEDPQKVITMYRPSDRVRKKLKIMQNFSAILCGRKWWLCGKDARLGGNF